MAISFQEDYEFSKGRALDYKIKKYLYSEKTPFQEIEIFDTEYFGRMFTLDGVVMMSEFDEFAYHEMIAHVPLMSHPNPRRVLVIGGGDGGTIREILKYASIEEVHLCEIDKRVVELCYEFFPKISNFMKDSKVKHVYDDGIKYIENHKEYFDCIIVDSTDPIGPGEVLFKRPFYEKMYHALRENGICTTQSESFYYHREIIQELFSFIPKIYPNFGYYYTLVPTYPSGVIGFSFCSKGIDPYQFKIDTGKLPKELYYYTPEIHKAAFTLPNFMKNIF